MFIQYQSVTVEMLLGIRANRFLAAKAGVREGSAAQDRTCISILPIHTYLSIYIYFYIDRYATIPFLLSLQGDSGSPESQTQAPGDCRGMASSHSSKDGGENLAVITSFFLSCQVTHTAPTFVVSGFAASGTK